MTDDTNQRNQLLHKLRRSIAYTVPALAIVAAGATANAVFADFTSEDGYRIAAAGEAEAEAEGHAEGEAEAEAEAEGEAEAEAEAEGEAEAEAEAEAEGESEAGY